LLASVTSSEAVVTITDDNPYSELSFEDEPGVIGIMIPLIIKLLYKHSFS
jgi:hypothetical protein